MPAMPWKSLTRADADREYLVMASALPLLRFSRILRFFGFVQAIRRQLASTQGLVGYSLSAKPFAKRYWTLSVWKDEEALTAFMRKPPHVEAMTALRPHMGPTRFVRWSVKGSETPVAWDTALRRLEGGS